MQRTQMKRPCHARSVYLFVGESSLDVKAELLTFLTADNFLGFYHLFEEFIYFDLL